MKKANYLLLLILMSVGSLQADKVTVIKTNEIFDNVKTTPNGRLETIIESKNGTKQMLKTKDISIVTSPVVWEETQAEKPSIWKRMFSKSEPETNKENPNEEPKSFFDRRFPEMAIGTMALLFFLLP
ncbi:hypothetical protein EHQ58_13800 [Leptospira ognonensis]|uniref:Uncharacterized protein n=1 Tax=Leptospira ognonensis TaxID=2484945 RepID=A0A4R9JWH3_9LEPT|nr:hypothetical protein [Leptospira ognonensis]TGL57364.1 hypothetical protein EHQ58_13800 [Leptospira ognonensis]